MLANARAVVAAVTQPDTPVSWDAPDKRRWPTPPKNQLGGNPVSHLNAVVNTPELREAYNSNLAKLSGVLHRALAKPGAVRQGQAGRQRRLRQAEAARRQIIEHQLRDFRLSGAGIA